MGKILLGKFLVEKKVLINVTEVIHQTEVFHGVVGQTTLMTARDKWVKGSQKLIRGIGNARGRRLRESKRFPEIN